MDFRWILTTLEVFWDGKCLKNPYLLVVFFEKIKARAGTTPHQAFSDAYYLDTVSSDWG